MYALAQSRTWTFAINTEDTVLKFKFNLCFKIKPYLGLELWTVLTKLSEEPCQSKRKRKLRGNPLQERDQSQKPSSTSGWDFTPLNRDNGLTLKYRNPRILIVFKCQNSSLDDFDAVNKLIEKKMEESFVTKLLMNARKSNQTVKGY